LSFKHQNYSNVFILNIENIIIIENDRDFSVKNFHFLKFLIY